VAPIWCSGSAWAWALPEAKGVGWAREMVVGGHCQSHRSIVVVWGVSSAKGGCLRFVAVRRRGHRRWCRGWASPMHSVAVVVEGGGGRGCWPC
jgi:hypothetical protein